METTRINTTFQASVSRLEENSSSHPEDFLLDNIEGFHNGYENNIDSVNNGIIASREVLEKTVLHYADLATQFGADIPSAYGPKENLYNALKLLTGKEPTPENVRGINKYLNSLKGKHVDENTLKEMISVWEGNPVEDSDSSGSSDEQIINGFIEDAQQIAEGKLPIHSLSKEKLYESLEKLTGSRMTDARKAAVDAFLDAIANNKPADVDALPGTNIKDILKVWERGVFRPIAEDPNHD